MCLDESYVEAGSTQPARYDFTSGPGTENDGVELAPHVSIVAHGGRARSASPHRAWIRTRLLHHYDREYTFWRMSTFEHGP